MLKFSKFLSVSLVIYMMLGVSPASMGNAAASEYDQAPEYLIKAGFLYKFFFFVQWPDAEHSSIKRDEKITIGVLGKDPFGDHFKLIEGRLIKSLNKRIVVKRLGRYRKGINLKQCQILYIGPSEKNNIPSIINRTKGTAILTVADTKGFLEMGGMVNLVDIKGRVRWEINLASIEQAGLIVSATLIQSAVRVIKMPESRDERSK